MLLRDLEVRWELRLSVKMAGEMMKLCRKSNEKKKQKSARIREPKHKYKHIYVHIRAPPMAFFHFFFSFFFLHFSFLRNKFRLTPPTHPFSAKKKKRIVCEQTNSNLCLDRLQIRNWLRHFVFIFMGI